MWQPFLMQEITPRYFISTAVIFYDLFSSYIPNGNGSYCNTSIFESVIYQNNTIYPVENYNRPL